MKSSLKILIIEDDIFIAKTIERQVKKIGYPYVDMAHTYSNAIDSIRSKVYDLLLIDIELDCGHSGIDIAYEKEVFNKIPIIYISGHDDSKTQEDIIATNAKHYLIKPFKDAELKVAIDLILKYKKGMIDIGYDFSYDLEYKNLFKNREPIKLTPKEKLLLEKLIEGGGNLIPEDLLISEIWSDKIPSDNSLRTLVGKLRNKLNHNMIINIPSFGYKLLC